MQCSVINIFWPLQTIFDSYILFMEAIYYFRRLYTTYGGYILLSAAIYYFRRLYITFGGYILLLALPDCDFVRIQDFITISRTYGLKARLDFNINLLALIQFCFFCSSMVSFINFNAPFWIFCFTRNTQILEMWNFVHLALQMVCMANK